MSVTVHDCDPDVDIECDGCEESIGSYGQKIYCAKCAGRKGEEELSCAKCRKPFPRGEMFSKIIGIPLSSLRISVRTYRSRRSQGPHK